MSMQCLNRKRTSSCDELLLSPSYSSAFTSERSKASINSIKPILNSPNPTKKSKSNLKKFEKEASKLNFFPIGSNENVAGNYEHYLSQTLPHIAQMKDIKFDYALESPSIYEYFPKNILERIVSSDKKILILDLDETLIHTDFEEEFEDDENNKYDAKISFYSEDKGNGFNRNFKLGKDENDNEAEITDEESKDDSKEKVLNTVGIFLRPGVKKFLEEVSENFEVGIFTASVPEYADAVIKYLDPENKYIKFRLYRNNCINVGDLLRVKNLNIIKNIPLKKVVLVDNNIYSFTAQLNNGILINSFYTDKNDNELSNVLSYLNNYILPAEDVREVNENFFGFQKIVNDIISNSI